MTRSPRGPVTWTVASSTASATHMSDGCTAMQALARAEDRVHAVEAADRRAARARLAFVAGRRDVVEVGAARALQEVAADRRHVAQLLRGAGQQRARQHRIALLDQRVIGQDRSCARARRCAARRRRSPRPVSSGSLEMSISLAGRSTSIFIRSTRLVPPATNFAPGLAAIWRTASATLAARAYWKPIMTAPSPAGSPRRCWDRRRTGRCCRSSARGFRRRSWPCLRRSGRRPSRSGPACSSRTGRRHDR